MTLRDTELYDEDSDTYFTSPDTYCKHGSYIGTPGGPEILCGACESGDPDPTPAELREWLAEDLAKLEERTLLLEWIGVEHPAFAAEIPSCTVNERNHVHVRRAQLAEALRWATHEHDDNWLNRRHRAERAA